MSRGKEEATAATISTPGTRNWGGNNNNVENKTVFQLGGEQKEDFREGKSGEV